MTRTKNKPKAPTCIECQKTAHLVTGAAIYPHRRDLHKKHFWRCERGAYCGCHPGSSNSLGSPSATGTRADRVIIDDPHAPLESAKPENATPSIRSIVSAINCGLKP